MKSELLIFILIIHGWCMNRNTIHITEYSQSVIVGLDASWERIRNIYSFEY